MAKQGRAANPTMDNRAQMMTQGSFAEPGYPDPSAIEASAVESNPGEILSMGNLTLPAPDEAAGQAQTPETPAQPAQAPVQPAAPPSEPEDPVTARFKAMTPEQLVEQAANLERLRGKHAEEVGTYRKLFDKFMEGGFPGVPQNRPQPQPEAPAPVEDESALVTEILTSPKKFMQKVEHQVMSRLEQQHRQMEIVNEFRKHEAVITSPQFQTWEKNIPQTLIEQAKSDPRALQWVVSQFQSAHQSPAVQPSTPAPAPAIHRVVQLGAANGGPTAATKPDTTKPIYTRAELARMMLDRPDEYRAREEELNLAYLEGRVK